MPPITMCYTTRLCVRTRVCEKKPNTCKSMGAPILVRFSVRVNVYPWEATEPFFLRVRMEIYVILM